MGAFSSTPSMLSGEQFIEAIRRGSVIEVEDYLSQGGNVNYKTESSSISSNNSFIGEGETGVQVASRDNKIEIVRILMQHDCDLNILDEFNNTAIMDSSKNGNIDIVRMLCEKKCHLNYRNNSGYTAVMRACICQHIDVAKVLIENGADISIEDNFGRKPLQVIHSSDDQMALKEHYQIHSPLTPWARRKSILIVLKENGYRPPHMNQYDLRHLQVFSDDNLLRIIVSYL